MAQPTQQMPQQMSQQVPNRNYSPGQHPSSPAPQQPGFALPSSSQNMNKRPQMPFSPGPQSNPPSPYGQQQSYPASPNVSTPTSATSPSYPPIQPAPSASPAPPTTPATAPSPAPAPVQQAPQYSRAAYTNGNTPSLPPFAHSHLNHPPTPTMSGPPTPVPGTPGTPGASPYVNAGFAPTGNQQPATGAMGPPPAKDRPQRTYEYEVTDSLLGTGVDIREEENALAEYYAGSFGQDSRTGFPANAPGNRGSFYGAGPANQPGTPATTGQKEFETALAEQRWNESAARLSSTRAVEHNNPFLQLANLHARAEKIARQYNLDLNLDTKTQPVQKSRNPADYPVAPKVNVTTREGPDGAMVSVYGSVLPQDSYLIDQLALLSIATKHRVRDLLEDADQIATTRQQTSHGVIPSDWIDSAVPLDSTGLPVNDGEAASKAIENGANGSNPRKRSLDASNVGGLGGRPSIPATNHLAQALREMGRAEREAEELRLKKRQKRLLGDSAANVSRSGSVAPGTPGSTAPEPEKAPTKKEQKKIAAQKHDASADNVNKTTMKFLGGGKKKYSWMSMGANTPSTPNKPTASAAGTPASASASASASKAPESKSLTQEGRYKLGSWREYSEKGKDIQLRDWITVLERDGREKLALQLAYVKLDGSEPR
ncbi:hypothetical protein N8I77_006024 [Diaporthe amygdali]|uniref:Transcription initiation factor TFIID subunit 4 n=1 Tax=Phomopsis amygdali TaxID=1214568 RepID=A0AAD9W402_PHOAM|nr:hypothetical protein N8I77_006024 [Diaporthe amygdali]